MRRFRFHLGTLVILVLLLGVGCASLRESNDTWDSSVFSITLAVLLISILLTIHRTGKRRAFWLGFALFGWIYLVLTLMPSIEPRLMTTKALAYLDSKVPRPIPRSVALYNLLVGNNSKPDAFFLSNSNGTFEDVKAMAGDKPTGNEVTGGGWFSNLLVGPAPAVQRLAGAIQDRCSSSPY